MEDHDYHNPKWHCVDPPVWLIVTHDGRVLRIMKSKEEALEYMTDALLHDEATIEPALIWFKKSK